MTELEISKALALAIGWGEKSILVNEGICFVRFSPNAFFHWRRFDYRDPAVIWPIAEQYNAFPYALRDLNQKMTGRWCAWHKRGDITADTAAKAVAMAVIGAKT